MCIFWTGWGSYFISFKDGHCHNNCFNCSSYRGSLVGVQRHYRPWWHHFSWIFLVYSGQMMSSVSVIKPLPTKEPRQDEQTKPLLCQSRPSKDMSFKPCFLTKIHTNYFRKKNWSLVFLTDNVSFAWWFCVYFFEQALEARGSYPLKAVTGTTTALLAHLAKALWLAKASLQTLTTSFVLNVPRKNLWPIQLSHKIWQKKFLHTYIIFWSK